MGRGAADAAHYAATAAGVLSPTEALALHPNLQISMPPRRWTATLSNFMRELSNHLCKRVVGEHAALVSQAGGGNGGDDSGQPWFRMLGVHHLPEICKVVVVVGGGAC